LRLDKRHLKSNEAKTYCNIQIEVHKQIPKYGHKPEVYIPLLKKQYCHIIQLKYQYHQDN